jgi:hypothetical protein
MYFFTYNVDCSELNITMKIRDFYTKNTVLNETLNCEGNSFFHDVHHYPSSEFKKQIYDHMKYPLKYILTVEQNLSPSAV